MIRASIRPNFAKAGTNGVPQTGPLLPLPYDRLNSYEHTIAAIGGFESQTLTFTGTVGEGLLWLDELMASNVTAGPRAQTIWEGFLSGVSFSAGGEQVSIDLSKAFTRVTCRFTYSASVLNGLSGTSGAQTNASAVARFGTKDLIIPAGQPLDSSTSAASVALRYLAQRAWPQATGTSSVSTGVLDAETQITLVSTGWYAALDWLLTSRNDTTAEESTEQLKYLLTQYNATNNFFSTDQRGIGVVGLLLPRTIDPDTSYRAKIEALMGAGLSDYSRIAHGVYENRAYKAAIWAGATPSTIHYKRLAGDGRLFTSGDQVVEPWDARPDKMLLVPTLLDPSPQNGSDSAARRYVERVTCRVTGDAQSVDLEPAQSDSVDVLLARIA